MIAVPVNAPADRIGNRLHVSHLLDNINPAINGGIGLRNSYGESRLVHYDEAGNVLVRAPEDAAGRAVVSESEEVSEDTRGEDSQPVAPMRRVAQHRGVTDRDDQHQRREYGGPAGAEVLRLDRPRTTEAVEPRDVHQQPDSWISLAAR